MQQDRRVNSKSDELFTGNCSDLHCLAIHSVTINMSLNYANWCLQKLVWIVMVAAVVALATESSTEQEIDLEQRSIWRLPSELGELGDKSRREGLRIDLMHRDHIHSGFSSTADVGLTTVDRIRKEIDHSAARGDLIWERLHCKKSHGQDPRIWPRRKVLEASHSLVNQVTDGDRQIPPTRYESEISITGGGYSMKISIGTPARSFTAFADTGSDLPWLQCKPCKSCFLQAEPIFEPSKSSSYRSVGCNSTFCRKLYEGKNFAGCSPKCKYEYNYLDHTHSRGEMALETLTLSGGRGSPNLKVPGFAFSCGHDNRGSLNQTGAGGIIGLGRGKLSLPSQLGPYIGSKFSTCFVNRFLAVKRTSPLFFGEMAVPSVPDVQYTSMLPTTTSFYYVNLEGISVGNSYTTVNRAGLLSAMSTTVESLGSGYVPTILDSGSTLTALVSEVYTPLIQAFRNHAPNYPQVDMRHHGLDLCFDVTDVADPRMPTLVFHLTNAKWRIPQENTVLILRDEESRGVLMCVALSQSKIDVNVIGNIHQQDFQILYDGENSRIGIASVKCDTL